MRVHINKNATIEKNLNGVFKGITDIIKVYNIDSTIAFFNEAGYKFYNKTPEQVNGQICYKINGRENRCIDCPFYTVMKTKQMVEMEQYMPEFNKFMDVCCNPILDEEGNVVYIVERLRDITDKKVLDNILKGSEERYRQIVNSLPDAVIITQDNRIVLANNVAGELIRVSCENLVGENIYKYIPQKYNKKIHKIFAELMKYRKTRITYEYEFNCTNRDIIYSQVTCSYIVYNSKPAILSVIRDISNIKKELNRAAEFQNNILQKKFPFENKLYIEKVYVPANKVSGDFYRIHKVNENQIVGCLVDVSGKGVTAALNISAFDITFFEELANTVEPIEIVKNINRKLVNHPMEMYIAICCFSIDFTKNELKVVGAGINRFILQKKGCEPEEMIIKGTFLGMFEESTFDEQSIILETGDKVFFLTDGLDFIFDEDKVIQTYMGEVGILDFKKFIDEYLNDTIIEIGTLKDDSTMLAMEYK
jgi:PAS domain S-box